MRLSDLDALEEKLDELERYVDERYHVWMPAKGVYNAINNAPVIIKCSITSDGLPLMDLRPRPQGEWIKIFDSEYPNVWHYECSKCHERPLCSQFTKEDFLSEFCPHCGARMVENGG